VVRWLVILIRDKWYLMFWLARTAIQGMKNGTSRDDSGDELEIVMLTKHPQAFYCNLRVQMTDSSVISESPSIPNDTRIRLTKVSNPVASQNESNLIFCFGLQRKLDDAFHVLDSAVSHDNADRPPPPKRSNTIRSLYSTLAKYGIKTKEPRISAYVVHLDVLFPSHLCTARTQSQSTSLSKSTPHLTAILSRAASKTKKSFSFSFSSDSSSPAPSLPATAEYRPSSLPSFLSRLATYKLSTYANKPASIDAVAASKCGWLNDGQDRLVCGLCKASWVIAGREGLNRDAGRVKSVRINILLTVFPANTLIEKQRASLIDAHKNGCPWKTRQCDGM